MKRADGNCQKEDWELLFEFVMAAEHMEPNDKNSIVLAMDVEPVTTIDPKFWKWEDQKLDDKFVTRPTRSAVINRGGTANIDQSFWEKLTKVMGRGIVAMIQVHHSQHKSTATPSVQAGLRELYRDW